MSFSEYEMKVEQLSESDGGGFLAWVPDLPGCMSDGDTRQDAIEHAHLAIAEWAVAAFRLGRSVPEPAKRLAED